MQTLGQLSEHMGRPLGSLKLQKEYIQGCVLVPTLLNLYLDAVISHALGEQQEKGVRIAYLHGARLVGNRRKLQQEMTLSDREYTDDVAIVANSWDDIKFMVESLNKHCCDMGLNISCSKMKIMGVLPSSATQKPESLVIQPGECPVEVVLRF